MFKELNLVLYFPRHLAYDNVALIINPVENINYWDHRSNILKSPLNESKGCIFLESSMSLNDQSMRKCILHNSEFNDYLYEKPIDCITLNVNKDVAFFKQHLPYFPAFFYQDLIRLHQDSSIPLPCQPISRDNAFWLEISSYFFF